MPISSLGSNFNPQNTQCIPPVKIITRLELDKFAGFRSDTNYKTSFLKENDESVFKL